MKAHGESRSWLKAEFENRERAHHEARIRTRQEVEELKKGFAALKLRELNTSERTIFPDKNCRKAGPQCINSRLKYRNYKRESELS